MWVPVSVWQPCELLYTCYLLTCFDVASLSHWSFTVLFTTHKPYCRVWFGTGFPRLVGSLGIVFVKFSGLGKSWKMSFVLEMLSARSWNLLGNDVDADAKICASAHLYSMYIRKTCSNSFFCYFFTTYHSDEPILQYGCCYHTMYIWLVTAVCLYI